MYAGCRKEEFQKMSDIMTRFHVICNDCKEEAEYMICHFSNKGVFWLCDDCRNKNYTYDKETDVFTKNVDVL